MNDYKETETLSYTLLCQLYDEVKELEQNAMKELNAGFGSFERVSATLNRTSTIKYLIEDKLFILWKEIDNNDRK